MYPSRYIRITQKDHVGTHKCSWAVDEAGSDGGIDYLIAPFTAKVKKIYTADANEVWLESINKVEYADGTKDYMTIMFAHDNNVSNLKVGQTIKQGQRFYEEGTKGGATGNHCHFECGKGKFVNSGWHKNSAGYWSINNGKKVTECLFIDKTYKVINTKGYTFKKVEQKATPTTSKKYYAKYTGKSGSIVDALRAIGADSSFNNRRAIAKANGIKGYVGTASQNIKMLNLLKQGKLIKRP